MHLLSTLCLAKKNHCATILNNSSMCTVVCAPRSVISVLLFYFNIANSHSNEQRGFVDLAVVPAAHVNCCGTHPQHGLHGPIARPVFI